MDLIDYFNSKEIARNGYFSKTMPPGSAEASSICYASTRLVIDKIRRNPNITAVITTRDLMDEVPDSCGCVVVSDPRLAYFTLHNRLVETGLVAPHDEHFIDATARIAASAIIGKRVRIEADVVIEHGAIIGDNTIVGAGTYIGQHVVTGAQGMMNTYADGKAFRLVYAGGVRIGQRCEILAAAILERPYQAFYTEVGDDCIVSVKTVVGHGVRIGRGTMIAGNAQLSGNVSVGDDVWIGPSSVISSDLSIGDRAQIKLGSVVVDHVQPGEHVSGNFAVGHVRHLRFNRRLKHGSV